MINMELLCLSLKKKKKNGIVERARDNVGANWQTQIKPTKSLKYDPIYLPKKIWLCIVNSYLGSYKTVAIKKTFTFSWFVYNPCKFKSFMKLKDFQFLKEMETKEGKSANWNQQKHRT